MKLTSTHHLRHLISKFHPPLPATPRESKQLESILRSSFKKRLDETHPAPQADYAVDLPSISPQPMRSNSAEATNIHLQAVLTHPLLGQRTLTAARASLLLPRLLRKWDQAVLQDKVDPPFIAEFIRTHQGSFKTSPENALHLATRIKQWFATTSNTRRELFLTDPDLVGRTIPIMYLGKLEEEVWDWLRLLYNGGLMVNNPESRYDLNSSHWLRVEDRFVSRMMEQSLQNSDCTGAAQQYIQACIYRTQTSRGAESKSVTSTWVPIWKLTNTALEQSWKVLSLAILRQRQSHGMSPALYDQMMDWRPKPRSFQWFDGSFLDLYRPSALSAQTLSQQIQKPRWTAAFASFLEQRASKNLKYHLLMAVFDAAELELEAGRLASSRAFLEFAENQFPGMVSSEKEANPSERVRAPEQVTHISMPKFAIV